MRTRRLQFSSDLVSATGHQSVLLQEVIEVLDIHPHETVVDGTLGGAGHAQALADRLSSEGVFVGIDADSDAIERASVALRNCTCAVKLVEGNFKDIGTHLENLGITEVHKYIFDLGWSSYHLDSGRGFSFQKNEPLLMTYEKDPHEETLTTRTIVNTWDEESIADVLWGWGEERFSRRIAKAIVEAREKASIETTKDLVEIIESAVPFGYKKGRIHPATKTFQALRIAVNQEMHVIEQGLDAAYAHLVSGGRIAVITFHSVEDRLVKNLFKKWKEDGKGEAFKVIKPSREEVQENPRSRSALLRVFEKTTWTTS